MLAGVGVVNAGRRASRSRRAAAVLLGVQVVEDLGFGDGCGRGYVVKIVLGLARGVGV